MSLREQYVERPTLADGQRADIIARPTRSDPIKLLQRRCADDIKYQIELVAIVTAREQRLSVQQLRKNAPDSPKVNRLSAGQHPQRPVTETTHLRVHLERQHDFRRAVPPGGDVLSHQPGFLPFCGGSLDTTGQTKVTHFEVAVGIEQKVGRFQIPMDDVRAVDGLERPEDLINEVLWVHRSDASSMETNLPVRT